MKAFVACIALALVACASAEAPGGYNYNRPSGGSSGGFGGLSGGGPLRSVSSGYQTSEGQNVDAQLLEQVRSILLKEEASAGSGSGFGGGHSAPSSSYGAPSSSYGAPSASYGPPSSSYGVPSARVVGIVLEGARQAIQVAQFEQESQGSSGGGYPAAGPSSSYGAPSAGVPSGSYGAPY